MSIFGQGGKQKKNKLRKFFLVEVKDENCVQMVERSFFVFILLFNFFQNTEEKIVPEQALDKSMGKFATKNEYFRLYLPPLYFNRIGVPKSLSKH